GQEALAWLGRGERLCLILLDLMMPRMNGWQFLEERQRDPALAAIPVVVLSAEARSGNAGGRSLGADDFLSKPAEPEVLLQVVARYCGGGRTCVKRLPGEPRGRTHDDTLWAAGP